MVERKVRFISEADNWWWVEFCPKAEPQPLMISEQELYRQREGATCKARSALKCALSHKHKASSITISSYTRTISLDNFFILNIGVKRKTIMLFSFIRVKNFFTNFFF